MISPRTQPFEPLRPLHGGGTEIGPLGCGIRPFARGMLAASMIDDDLLIRSMGTFCRGGWRKRGEKAARRLFPICVFFHKQRKLKEI